MVLGGIILSSPVRPKSENRGAASVFDLTKSIVVTQDFEVSTQ